MSTYEKYNVSRLDNLSTVLARISFLAYLFFIFFGTSMPFQDITEVEDLTTSNPINQYGFSTLYLLSSLNLIINRDFIFRLVKSEKFMCLFLLWSFLSVFWSEVSFVSFKRWLQVFGSAVICLSVLITFHNADEALNYLKVILVLYIPLTFLSLVTVPAAIELGSWRGLASQKNMLGQISLVSLIIWSLTEKDWTNLKKIFHLVFLILSIILLIGSNSGTSMLTAIMLLAAAVFLRIDRFIFRPMVGGFFAMLFFATLAACLLTVIIFGPGVVDSLFAAFGKDLTLTGRTDLWSTIFEETRKHWLLGWGFGGFWVVTRPEILNLYEEFSWLPNQAHLGYLDILNETGIIGILIFVFMCIFCIKNLLAKEEQTVWKWFVFTVLILNLTESTLFRANALTGVLFIYSYLALAVDRVRLDIIHQSQL